MKKLFAIETGTENVVGHCDCCGHESRLFRGFVYQDDAAHGVYVCYYTARHSELGVSMAISLGGWGENADPSNKECILLEWRKMDAGPACRVVDFVAESWVDERLLGRVISRDESMASGRASEAFAVSDAVWLVDQRLSDALKGD